MDFLAPLHHYSKATVIRSPTLDVTRKVNLSHTDKHILGSRVSFQIRQKVCDRIRETPSGLGLSFLHGYFFSLYFLFSLYFSFPCISLFPKFLCSLDLSVPWIYPFPGFHCSCIFFGFSCFLDFTLPGFICSLDFSAPWISLFPVFL